mmetsp:Transcript_43771/g.93104  ORF Transcript_43771/g.93104 Transcript_43771/m.93104 type:complete len:349 (-) Transcript_43771:150-1196(-)
MSTKPLVQPQASWEPVENCGWRTTCGRLLSFWCYPAVLPYCLFSHCDFTFANAKWWRAAFTAILLGVGVAAHSWAWGIWSASDPLCASSVLAHLVIFLTLDHTHLWLIIASHLLMEVLCVDRRGNRLNACKLHGPRVLVVGNGPSALDGEPLGDRIDEFDEVVRFNNFQNKTAGMEKFVGTKTTVHFSDGVLYPTYKEYHVAGADVVLSLITDRYMVAGTYFILRGGADLQTRLTMNFLKDPNLSWIEKSQIERLKELLGLTWIKHPTSGMLAIDHFLNMPGVQLPVYIHGFDFFMGPKIHYFDAHEPLYERVNNHIGVNMHSPHKEKIYVEKLIAEGKVRFLKDMPK